MKIYSQKTGKPIFEIEDYLVFFLISVMGMVLFGIFGNLK